MLLPNNYENSAIGISVVRRAKPLLGTLVEIILESKTHTQSKLTTIATSCFERISKIQRLMSFYESESDIGRLNKTVAGLPIKVSSETYQVLRLAQEISIDSEFRFDIFAEERINYPESKIEFLDDLKIARHTAAKVDLGGIAKGYAADAAAEVAHLEGVENGIINAGGDIVLWGKRSFPFIIRSPLLNGSFRTMPPQTNCSIATSTLGEREYPVSIAVRANSCMIADALTKGIFRAPSFVRGMLLKKFGATYVIIEPDGSAMMPDFVS